MKKNIFLTLALALTFVGTAWGQSTTEYFKVTSVAINANYPFVYDGTEKKYITSYGDNCDQSNGDPMGNTATNAGSYTATISSQCYGHPTTSGSDYYEEFHVGSVTYNWSIQPRDISKTTGYDDDLYVAITVKDQKWTGDPIELTSGDNGIYTIKFKDNDLTADDVDVYITKENSTGPVTILDEGRYTIVFTGKGNFTGTVTKTFDVKKELADNPGGLSDNPATINGTGIHFYIPTQLEKADGSTFKLNIQAVDLKSGVTLYENENFTLKYFDNEEAANQELLEPDDDDDNNPAATSPSRINADRGTADANGKQYWFVAEGMAPKYQGKIKQTFYVVYEYQTYKGTNGRADVNLHIVEPGYPVAANSPTGEIIKGKMEVAPRVIIKTLTIGSGDDAVTVNYVEGDTWGKVVKRNPDKLEKKPESSDPKIYKKGTDSFVVYDPERPDTSWISAATVDTINSTTYYWWEQ